MGDIWQRIAKKNNLSVDENFANDLTTIKVKSNQQKDCFENSNNFSHGNFAKRSANRISNKLLVTTNKDNGRQTSVSFDSGGNIFKAEHSEHPRDNTKGDSILLSPNNKLSHNETLEDNVRQNIVKSTDMDSKLSPNILLGDNILLSPNKMLGDNKMLSPNILGAPKILGGKKQNNQYTINTKDLLTLSKNEVKFLHTVKTFTQNRNNEEVVIRRGDFLISDTYFYSSRKGLVEKKYINFFSRKNAKNREEVVYILLRD